MSNKYAARLERLADEYRIGELKQFEGPDGKAAHLDDRIWYHIDPNSGRRTRYLCGRYGRKGRGKAGNLRTDALRYPYNCLIKAWIIETANTALSASEKQARSSVARKLLTLMDGELYAQSEGTIRALDLGASAVYRLRPFLAFCAEKGLMRTVKLKDSNKRDRTGQTLIDNMEERLPSVESVLALGAIFSTTFRGIGEDNLSGVRTEIDIHDALVVTFALLSLASPNRMAAEIPLLSKQRLGSYTERSGEEVYYLDWIGSKGHGNNRNHMLSALAEPLKRSLNFFFEICEPARVLCRFYENPRQSLKNLLGDFAIEHKFKKNLSLTQQPNLFTLGYALGFYDANGTVPVLREGADLAAASRSQRRKLFCHKPIPSLTSEDIVSLSNIERLSLSALPHLFGYSVLPKIFGDELAITIGEVQGRWISYFKRSILPEFPFSFSSGESKIRLKDAMFCFLGSWLYGDSKQVGGAGKVFQKTKYAVVPLASLGASVSARLSGSHQFTPTIFQSHGFSSEMRLRPHALRHFSNTLADLSSIPIEVITAWSGRKNAEQTHTYIHTSHEDKASRVSAVINPSAITKNDIRVVSQEKLIHAANLPASLTSTGVCIQDLNVTPCNHLNDFAAQCFMCPETCHIAGDEKAIGFLEKDLLFQSKRLQSASSDPRLSASEAMRQWFLVHSRNTHLLSVLIDLMRKSPSGTVIRYTNTSAEFNLTDLKTMVVTKVSAALPNHESELTEIVEARKPSLTTEPNSQLRLLLSSFGLAEGES